MKKIAIFGLGNPDEKYNLNRHNIGFIIIDQLNSMIFSEENEKFELNKKLEGHIRKDIIHKDKKIILAKPLTFMNNSGSSVLKVMKYYNIPEDNILIIHDDLDLPFGSIRFSKNSGPAGLNGIKSLIDYLGNQNFARLRIGIANRIYKQNNPPSEKFVLENFSQKEMQFLDSEKNENGELSREISKAILFYIENGFDETKIRYNKSAMPLIELEQG